MSFSSCFPFTGKHFAKQEVQVLFHVFVPCFNTLFGTEHCWLAVDGNAPFIDCVPLSSSHTGSQRSGHPTDQAPAWLPPANLVLAEPWSRVLPHCYGRHSLPAAETLLPGPSCLWFPA